MGSKERNAYLHLGMHKTATTSLQFLIERNAKTLVRQGVMPIVREPQQFASLCHGSFASEWDYKRQFLNEIRFLARNKKGEGRYTQARRSLSEVLERLEVNSHDVLISDEELLGRRFGRSGGLYPEAKSFVRTLSTLLPQHRPRVILYVREQDQFLESCYVQNVHMGRAESFAAFLERVNCEKLHWSGLAERIASVVGGENLTVQPFSKIRTGFEPFARDFFSHFSDPTILEISSVHSNPSLSGVGISIARALGGRLPRKYWNRVRPVIQWGFSRRVFGPAQLMTPSKQRELRSFYEADMAAVVQKYPSWAKDSIKT